MNSCLANVLRLALFLSLIESSTATAQTDDLKAKTSKEFQEKLKPFLGKYCLKCHSADKPKAGLNLAKFDTPESLVKDRKIWQRAAEYLETGEMPPEESLQPSTADAESMAGWVQTYLSSVECKPEDQSPGRVTLRRLNRVEYRNTVRDLVGVDYKPTDEFPSDDVGYGFDNIGDVLTLSTVLMEKYFDAAEQIVDEAILSDFRAHGPAKLIDLEKVKATEAVKAYGEGGKYFISAGSITFPVKAEAAGDYRLKIRAWGDQGGSEPARMKVKLDGLMESVIDVPALRTSAGDYETLFKVAKPGDYQASISFINDSYLETKGDIKGHDRNLMVETVQWFGPAKANPSRASEFHRQTFSCHPDGRHADDCARKIVAKLAERAFRRPPRGDEVGRLMDLFGSARRSGESFESGIGLVLKVTLISPHFLFKIEADPNFKSDEKVRKLNDYELATRLSYFLHSSMPDNELYEIAKSGKLTQGDNLEKQVRRLLSSQRSGQFVENFAMQWLQLRNLQNIVFDRKRFPKFDIDLRRNFVLETRQYLSYVIREDRSILELLDSDYTFLNDQLAKYYGIKDVEGNRFRKVSLTDSNRGGLVTQASILAVTSNPTRTSPVKRGRWILEQILGTPPPPPPPNVPELKADEAELSGTLRQKMEQHRKDPACANCHAKMDPLGFGLENFDAVGAWRTIDGKDTIDASGVLPSGESFTGPAQLKKILITRKRDFTRNLTEKMLIYGLGRGLDSEDQCAVEKIVKAVEKDGYKFSRLVLEIVRSEPFEKRLTSKAKP
ncbi:MAG: DUF1592 domain-containing protein [Planctomycetota bacterium]